MSSELLRSQNKGILKNPEIPRIFVTSQGAETLESDTSAHMFLQKVNYDGLIFFGIPPWEASSQAPTTAGWHHAFPLKNHRFRDIQYDNHQFWNPLTLSHNLMEKVRRNGCILTPS